MRFLGELKRRQVIRVAVVYAVVALGVGEAADIFLGNIGPSWAVPTVLIVLLLGFPVSLVPAWAYDLTPQGVVRDRQDGWNRVHQAEEAHGNCEPATASEG